MSYQKHDFLSKQKLTAKAMNEIEAGVVQNESMINQLSKHLNEQGELIADSFEYYETNVTMSLLEAKLINKTTGEVIDVTDGNANYKVSEPISVQYGEQYLLTASMNWDNPVYALYAEDNTLISTLCLGKNSECGVIENKLIIIPKNATTMRVSFIDQYRYSLGKVYEKKLVAGKIDGAVVGYRNLDNKLAAAFEDNEYTEITLDFAVKGHLLDYASGESVAYSKINHTDYIDISTYEKLWITGRNYLSCTLVAFYDKYKRFIAAYPNTNKNLTIDEKISIPVDYKYMIVTNTSSIFGASPSIKCISSYKPSGSEKKWAGKKWVCVGDSLTESNSRTTKSYHDYVAETTGITVVNMGRSGSGYARAQDKGYAFYQRIVNVPTDADVVTIFGSGNDLGAGLEIGTPSDTGLTTLCGCINTTIDELISIMPTVSLGIVSPTPWVGSPPSDTSCQMALYSNALKTICEYRSIPFLDLYHCSNLRPWTEEGRLACYTKDDGNGVHPDETGHALIAPRFKAFLEMLIM